MNSATDSSIATLDANLEQVRDAYNAAGRAHGKAPTDATYAAMQAAWATLRDAGNALSAAILIR